jgi:hypothetical protein
MRSSGSSPLPLPLPHIRTAQLRQHHIQRSIGDLGDDVNYVLNLLALHYSRDTWITVECHQSARALGDE